MSVMQGWGAGAARPGAPRPRPPPGSPEPCSHRACCPSAAPRSNPVTVVPPDDPEPASADLIRLGRRKFERPTYQISKYAHSVGCKGLCSTIPPQEVVD